MPIESTSLDPTSLRQAICSLLHCQDFCPKCGNEQCKACQEAVEKASQIADKIIQVLDEWEQYTPWPD